MILGLVLFEKQTAISDSKNMNRQPIISRREQQDFIRDQGTKMLHFAIRACPCDGVGCRTCDGKMKYYDDPVPIHAAITNGMNSKKKNPPFPTQKIGQYNLIFEPRYHITDGDRVTPFGMREFEDISEILTVEEAKLTFIPIKPRGVTISFTQKDGGVVNYVYGVDFTIEKEFYGRVPLWSKQIQWINNPASGQEKFSVRYGYIPDFELDGTPVARIAQGQTLLPEGPLKKLTIGGQKKAKSHEQSSDAIRGVKGGLQYD